MRKALAACHGTVSEMLLTLAFARDPSPRSCEHGFCVYSADPLRELLRGLTGMEAGETRNYPWPASGRKPWSGRLSAIADKSGQPRSFD